MKVYVMRTLLPLLLLVGLLGLTSCQRSDEACAVEISKDLDDERYGDVISALENNQTCNGVFTAQEAWMNLAAAYMSQAGVSVTALSGMLMSAIGGGEGGQSDPMAAFASISELSTQSGLSALGSAQTVYGYILEGVNCSNTANVYEDMACMYNDFIPQLRTFGLLSAFMGGDVSIMDGAPDAADDVDSSDTHDFVELTTFAISVAGDATASQTAGSLSYTTAANETFNYDGTNFIFTPRTHTLTSSTAYPDATMTRMLYNGDVAITSGSCTTAFVPCDTINLSSCFPCPIILDGAVQVGSSDMLQP